MPVAVPLSEDKATALQNGGNRPPSADRADRVARRYAIATLLFLALFCGGVFLLQLGVPPFALQLAGSGVGLPLHQGSPHWGSVTVVNLIAQASCLYWTLRTKAALKKPSTVGWVVLSAVPIVQQVTCIALYSEMLRFLRSRRYRFTLLNAKPTIRSPEFAASPYEPKTGLLWLLASVGGFFGYYLAFEGHLSFREGLRQTADLQGNDGDGEAATPDSAGSTGRDHVTSPADAYDDLMTDVGPLLMRRDALLEESVQLVREVSDAAIPPDVAEEQLKAVAAGIEAIERDLAGIVPDRSDLIRLHKA